MASPPEGFASLHDPSAVRSATAARSRDEGVGTYPCHVNVSKGSQIPPKQTSGSVASRNQVIAERVIQFVAPQNASTSTLAWKLFQGQ